MGKKDDRYGKLEIDTKENEPKKKDTIFSRKLEIFGIPAAKKKVETHKPAVDDLTPPPEPKKPIVEKTAIETTNPRRRHNPKTREQLKKKFEDLQSQSDEYAEGNNSIPQYTKYDEQLKKNREMPERNKILIEKSAEAAIRKEETEKRIKSAQSTIMWGGILVVGLIILLLLSGGTYAEAIFQIGLTILFIYLGIRRGNRTWRR
jgi:hypothetical protein